MNYQVGNTISMNVFHRGDYNVLCKNSLEEIRKNLTFVLEKNGDAGLLKIMISDDNDPCFLCVLTVTRSDYDELKKLQGLLVDFDNFPAQLVRLLQQCTTTNMFLNLQQNGPLNVVLEIVEHNEFKRLVHLSLKSGLASDADIKKNMADNILLLKEKVSKLSTTLSSKEALFHDKEQRLDLKIRDLSTMLSRAEEYKIKMEDIHQETLKKERDKLETERLEWQKCAEMCSKTQINSMQDALSRKEKLLEDASIKSRQMQETLNSLESQMVDKKQRILTLEKQLHVARTDAEAWRNQTGALDRDYHDKDMNLQDTRSRLIDVEKTLKDKSEMLRETLESLQILKREKMNLDDRLNNNEAVTSELQVELQNINQQLLKANQIISKQNTDLINLREKLMCRTAIALEQEKVIERNSCQMAELQSRDKEVLAELDRTKKNCEFLKVEADANKRLMNEKIEVIKNNNTVIQWLHKKLEASQSTNDFTAPPISGRVASLYSSTPFMSTRSNNDKGPADNNNDLLNVYSAGLNRKSVTSNMERFRSEESGLSNGAQPLSEERQFSVDPIYLRPSEPASNQATSRSKSQDSIARTASSKGSERVYGNKDRIMRKDNIGNYCAEKTPRSVKYRNAHSPVSAYFPKP